MGWEGAALLGSVWKVGERQGGCSPYGECGKGSRSEAQLAVTGRSVPPTGQAGLGIWWAEGGVAGPSRIMAVSCAPPARQLEIRWISAQLCAG